MRFVCCLIAGMILIGVAPAQGRTIVSGIMKNAASGDPIQLYVPHFYIDNESSRFKTTINSRQEFSIEADITDPQVAFLIFDDDQIAVFLEPDDTLLVKSDLFQFPLSVSFGGRAGANNRLLKEYSAMAVTDNNEFNNVRFKVGQWWFGIESDVNETMLVMDPPSFKIWADSLKKSTFDALDRYVTQQPNEITPAFREWMEAEGLYTWAWHLLMYGQVYKNRYSIEEPFFEFLYEAPVISTAVSNEAYRQFVQVLMARYQTKNGDTERFYAGQYDAAGQLLDGKSLAFFRSEIIRMAFSSDRFQEILPAYLDFMRHNRYPAFEPKLTAVYERTSRLAPGTVVPAFSGKDFYKGETFSQQTLKGKVIYLNFWASWCGACIKKMDYMSAFVPDLQKSGVEIVNISIDENKTAWEDALLGTRFAGYHLLSKNYPEQELALKFGVQAVPQYFIVAPNGIIAEKPYSNQPDEIMKKLLQMAEK